MIQPDNQPDVRPMVAFIRDCVDSANALELEAQMLREEAKLYRKLARCLVANLRKRVML